jgi:hypothetical protein
MRTSLTLLAIVAANVLVYSQSNVGIGETNPGARLTVKAGADNVPLLIKSATDDTAYFMVSHRHYIGGYTNTSSSSLTLNNKYFLPIDNPQLTIMASGEASGGFVNGSFNKIEFRNLHTNQRISLYSYLGATVPQFIAFDYFNADAGTTSSLLALRANGQISSGTFSPTGKMQLNHRSSAVSPSLNLVDSTVNGASIMQLRNLTSGNYWQIRGLAHSTTPASSLLDFATQSGVQMTLTGTGNLGIGDTSPDEKLAVSGNISSTGIIRLTGELNRTATGATHLLPIAFGNISAAGNLHSDNSGNVAVSKLLTGWYAITITGESYQFQTYTAVVTPVGSAAPIVVTTGSGGGNFYVFTWNIAGVATDSQFCFVVYKH